MSRRDRLRAMKLERQYVHKEIEEKKKARQESTGNQRRKNSGGSSSRNHEKKKGELEASERGL